VKSTRASRRPRLNFSVQYAVSERNQPTRARLRQWARAALEHDAQITVRIVGRAEGKVLNRKFRGRDCATNVLTFVFSDTPPYGGDLALCAPVVAREAREQRKSAAAHYAHLVVHGVLHLQGYDHAKDTDARVMERRESQIVTKLGYPDPYAKDEGGRMKAEGRS
jgi:probable rRNA maturation factor